MRRWLTCRHLQALLAPRQGAAALQGPPSEGCQAPQGVVEVAQGDPFVPWGEQGVLLWGTRVWAVMCCWLRYLVQRWCLQTSMYISDAVLSRQANSQMKTCLGKHSISAMQQKRSRIEMHILTRKTACCAAHMCM